MRNLFRFIYLNFYFFLLLICGIVLIIVPLYKVSMFLLIPQILLSLFFIYESFKLLSAWKDKQLKYEILKGKNSKEFRPETFKIFMQAPCGRLLVKSVLKDLNMKYRYKELLVYKQSFIDSLKNNIKPQKAVIYINEELK